MTYRICPELYQASKTVSGTLVRIQLLGQHPQWLAENAARSVELGSWGVDFNCGCPSPTVNGHGGGATLLKDPERIYQAAKADPGVSTYEFTYFSKSKVRLG